MIMIAAKAFFLFFCYILLRYETFVIALEEALKDMLPSLKDRAMKVDNCTFHCFKPRTLHLHPLRSFSTLSLCSFFFPVGVCSSEEQIRTREKVADCSCK